jgi:fido (protein-threonine AMPylation protein)
MTTRQGPIKENHRFLSAVGRLMGSFAWTRWVARKLHRLVKIHPFANGNGRHARIVANTVLDRIYETEAIDWAGGYDLQK